MVKNYYLFRHGQTFFSKFQIPYGKHNLNAKILPEGKASLLRIGEFLKGVCSDCNISSEFLRCKQSVKIIEEISGKDFVFDPRLNEYYKVNFDDFKKRIANFLEEINKDPKNETVVICTHGAVIAGLKHLITEGQFNIREILDYPSTGVLLCIENKKIEERNFNLSTSLFKFISKAENHDRKVVDECFPAIPPLAGEQTANTSFACEAGLRRYHGRKPVELHK